LPLASSIAAIAGIGLMAWRLSLGRIARILRLGRQK
jgi:hypothetical protein